MSGWITQERGHPATRRCVRAHGLQNGHLRSSAVKKPQVGIGIRLNRRFHRGTQMILGWGEDGFGGGCHAEARGARRSALR